jgi:hypothetical protein
MTQKSKIIIASVALVGLGYYLMNRKKVNPVSEDLNKPDTSAMLDFKKVLSKGTVSPEVGQLQTALGQLKVDDIFGVLTQARLLAVTGKKSISLEEYNKIITK